MDEFRRRLLMIQLTNEESGGDLVIPAKDGVYILGTDNKFYKTNEWNKPNSEAVGVGFIYLSNNFIIAPSVITEELRWSAQYKEIQGILTTNIQSTALEDRKGYENTQKILEQDSQAEAALACKNYHFKNGMTGYLPSLGELKLIQGKRKEVNEALQKIGSEMLGANMFNDVYWSSTQYDSNIAWRMYLADGYTTETDKKYSSIVLPLAKLK